MSYPGETEKYEDGSIGKVSDVLRYIGARTVPVVNESASVGEIVTCFVESSYSRVIYVTAEDGSLLGSITQQELVKHVFIHFHDEYLDKRSLLSQAVAETAADLMHNERLHCQLDDDLGGLLTEMISFHQDEVPIVDSQNKIIHDITMIDIIRYCATIGVFV